MGLSIHYSGRFNPEASLEEMIEEVKDIADIYKWEFHILDTSFPEQANTETYTDDVFGIFFTPPGCETVSIEFLSNKRMSSVMHLQFYGHSDRKDYQEYLYMLSVKTQYAGIEIHKVLIHLFKYLNEKYFLDFKMIDEGKYWETGDENILKETFALYTELINSFCEGLKNFPAKKDETIETYFGRLVEYINKKRKKK